MAWKIATDNLEGKGFIAGFIVFAILDLFCVLVRLCSRHLQCKIFRNPSDYVLIFGFVCE